MSMTFQQGKLPRIGLQKTKEHYNCLFGIRDPHEEISTPVSRLSLEQHIVDHNRAARNISFNSSCHPC